MTVSEPPAPSNDFLLELADALLEAKHQNVAEHFTAGLLWAMYPEWFENHFKKENTQCKSESLRN